MPDTPFGLATTRNSIPVLWGKEIPPPPYPTPTAPLHIWNPKPAKEAWKQNLRCAELLPIGK